ncbi:hypothetical protein [Arthrobacter sp. Y81]|uniref:hypothetical protein n=1 Tax=Arthrobacter sp. Y81 TaxID=2058897 RepID=UPI0011AFFBEC|nr:hypothetical protein [Arthrobacter sp. Y81]
MSADIDRTLKDLDGRSIKVTMDEETLRKANQQVQDSLKAAGAAGLRVDITTNEGLEQAQRDIDKFLRENDNKPVKFKANMTGLDIAAAQLKYATRDRRVNFFIDVNKKSLLVAEGLIKSLSGLGVLTSVGNRLESLITNFDKFSLKSAGWATAIAALVNTLAFVGTSAFTVGEGVVQSIGLLAALPTALAAVAAGVLINVAAFKNFKSAIDGDVEALAALPPQARAAAKALQGTWKSIQRPVQAAFWEGMGDSIQRFAANAIPVLRDGLTRAADDVGRFNAGILDSFDEIARNGSMAKMFGNLEGFFKQASAASRPFADALNVLGLRGSEYLPRFGGFLTDISQGFKDWVVESDKAGKINVWIEEGVQSLKDMGGVGVAVVDMFKGITRAVNDAGGGGLPEFRKNMRGIADIMLAEPFRSRMATIFAGARKGASELNVGVKDLGETIGTSAGYVNQLLTGLGKLGGGLLSGLAKTLGQLQFQTGTLEGIRDMQGALDDLGPSFAGLGRIIGNMSRVAGEIFKGVAPVINTVVGFLDKSVGKLSGNLEKVAGPLTGLVNALVTAASGPLTMIVDVLSATLGLFGDLPRPLQIATGAFLGLLALRGPLGAFLTMAQSSMARFAGAFTGSAKIAADGGKRIGDMVYYADGTVRRFDAAPMNRQLGSIQAKAASVAKSVGGSLLALAGGPWGLAIAGAVAAIALMGDAAAKQKSKLDDLRTALDGQTGINAATERVIASQLRAKDSFLWLERASIADNASAIGISLRDIQKAAEGVPESVDKVNDSLKRAAESRDPFEKVADTLKGLGGSQMLGPLSSFADAVGNLFGSTGAKAGIGLQKLRDDLEAVKVETAATAKQLGVPVGVTAGIMSAIETLASKASTADDKLRAVNDIIRQMNGKTNLDDAVQTANDSARDFVKNLEAIVEIGKGEGLALPSLFKADGSIDTVSKAGSDLRTELTKVADAGRDSALKLALAQKDPQVAIETLRTKMGETRALIAKQLEVGQVPPEQIEAILAQLDLDPAKIEFLLNPESKDKALADLAIANGQAQAAMKPAVVGLDVDARTNFGPRLQAATNDLGIFTNLKPKPTLDANDGPFSKIVSQAEARGVDFGGKTHKPNLDANSTPFDNVIGTVKAAGNLLAQTTFKTTIDAAGNALDVVGDIWATLTKFSGQSFAFNIAASIATAISGSEQANGSIYNRGGRFDPRFAPKFFANGGIERHVAQIAKPSSTLRVWAEPETGGEAYIPLAASKRARSVAILDEVAGRFGYELYAKGGIHGGGAGASPSGDTHYHSHIDASPGVAYLYAKEIALEATTKQRDAQALYDYA